MPLRSIKQSFSLNSYLVVIVLVAIVPVLVFCGVVFSRLIANERQTSQEFLSRASENLARLVGHEFDSSIRALKTLASADSLRTKNYEAFHRTLIRTLKSHANWTNIFVHDENQNRVLSTSAPYDGVIRPTVEAETLRQVYESKEPLVGKVTKGPRGNYAFAVRVPVVDEKGAVEYVLSAVIGIDRIQGLLNTDDSVPHEYVRAVIDQAGVLAARSRDPEKFGGQLASASLRAQLRSNEPKGLAKTLTLEGLSAHSVYHRVPGYNWYVALAVPSGVLDARSTRTFWTLFGLALILLCLSSGATVVLARGLRDSIRAAGAGAAALSRGEEPDLARSPIKEIEELRNSLLSASQLLRSREKTKSNFLANMSHELRTPLGIVIGMVDSLASNSISESERQGVSEIVKRNGAHLLRLIDDILDVAKLEANKLMVEAVDFSLRDLIASVVEDFTPSVRQRGVQLRTIIDPESPDLINSDPVRVRQVLVNLLGNATKFTQKGSIELKLHASRIDQIRLSITDTGVGISEVHQAALFTDFSQIDSSHTRKFGGTGLGLSLSRKLARLLGGEVRLVQSKLGLGTTFEFSFSAKPSTSKAEVDTKPKKTSSGQVIKSGRILLAEDSPDNVTLIKAYLRNIPIEISIASNGLEALELAKKSEFDLILMDIQMPTMDGYEATQKLREAQVLTPIVALTAHALAEHRATAIDAGFTDYLTKPLRREILLEVVERYLADSPQ